MAGGDGTVRHTDCALPGKKHLNADSLSRMPDKMTECDCYHAGAVPESLLCGGCAYCVRAQHQWSRFTEDVDDVVPLSVKTVKVNPGDDGAESQVNLLGRKAPRSSISHEQDTTVHEFDPDETIPYQEDFSKASNWAPSYSQLEIRSLHWKIMTCNP